MGRKIIFLSLTIFCCVPDVLLGQEFQKDGLIKATATIAPGVGYQVQRFYLHGHLEYFPEEKVSLRGDGYVNMGSQFGNSYGVRIKSTHSTFFGILYHLKENTAFDPYVGLQPGIALSVPDLISPVQAVRNYKLAVSPLLSVTAGVNYYVGDYFNFFASGQYVTGKATGINGYGASLDEFRVSAGLGFNINIKPKKNKNTPDSSGQEEVNETEEKE